MDFFLRLQGLPLEAQSMDIRYFFRDFQIPVGGVHIVGGENDEAHITFLHEEDLLQALQLDTQHLCGKRVRLLIAKKGDEQLSVASKPSTHQAPHEDDIDAFLYGEDPVVESRPNDVHKAQTNARYKVLDFSGAIDDQGARKEDDGQRTKRDKDVKKVRSYEESQRRRKTYKAAGQSDSEIVETVELEDRHTVSKHQEKKKEKCDENQQQPQRNDRESKSDRSHYLDKAQVRRKSSSHSHDRESLFKMVELKGKDHISSSRKSEKDQGNKSDDKSKTNKSEKHSKEREKKRDISTDRRERYRSTDRSREQKSKEETFSRRKEALKNESSKKVERTHSSGSVEREKKKDVHEYRTDHSRKQKKGGGSVEKDRHVHSKSTEQRRPGEKDEITELINKRIAERRCQEKHLQRKKPERMAQKRPSSDTDGLPKARARQEPGYIIIFNVPCTVTATDLRDYFSEYEIAEKGVTMTVSESNPGNLTAGVRFVYMEDAINAESIRDPLHGRQIDIQFVSEGIFMKTLKSKSSEGKSKDSHAPPFPSDPPFRPPGPLPQFFPPPGPFLPPPGLPQTSSPPPLGPPIPGLLGPPSIPPHRFPLPPGIPPLGLPSPGLSFPLGLPPPGGLPPPQYDAPRFHGPSPHLPHHPAPHIGLPPQSSASENKPENLPIPTLKRESIVNYIHNPGTYKKESNVNEEDGTHKKEPKTMEEDGTNRKEPNVKDEKKEETTCVSEQPTELGEGGTCSDVKEASPSQQTSDLCLEGSQPEQTPEDPKITPIDVPVEQSANYPKSTNEPCQSTNIRVKLRNGPCQSTYIRVNDLVPNEGAQNIWKKLEGQGARPKTVTLVRNHNNVAQFAVASYNRDFQVKGRDPFVARVKIFSLQNCSPTQMYKALTSLPDGFTMTMASGSDREWPITKDSVVPQGKDIEKIQGTYPPNIAAQKLLNNTIQGYRRRPWPTKRAHGKVHGYAPERVLGRVSYPRGRDSGAANYFPGRVQGKAGYSLDSIRGRIYRR